MDFQLLFICGAIAGLLSVFAYLPYMLDTLRRRTQPQRSTWLIWSILSSMSFFSQLSEGATDSLWFSGVQASGTIIVSLLSIRFGTGNFFNRADSFILMGAGFGLYLWYITDTAVYALAISIGISTLGGVLTVAKAYRDPESESILAWLISFIATIFAIASVGKPDAVLLAYPVYLFALYGSIILAMLLGKTMESRRSADYLSFQPVQNDVVFRTLVSNTHEKISPPSTVVFDFHSNNRWQDIQYGLSKLNDDNVTALVSSLKKRGVGEHVLSDALRDVSQCKFSPDHYLQSN